MVETRSEPDDVPEEITADRVAAWVGAILIVGLLVVELFGAAHLAG